MASFDDQQLSLAEVYAEALFKLAKERHEEAAIGGELKQFAEALDSDPAIGEYLSSPAADTEDRAFLLEKLLRGKANDVLVDALQVMSRNGRLGLVPAVQRAYHDLYEAQQGRVEVSVRSAAAVSPAQQARLRDMIKKKTGKEADLILEMDAELIGGLVIQLADRKLDASVRHSLQQVIEAFRERGSRELQRIGEYVEGAA